MALWSSGSIRKSSTLNKGHKLYDNAHNWTSPSVAELSHTVYSSSASSL